MLCRRDRPPTSCLSAPASQEFEMQAWATILGLPSTFSFYFMYSYPKSERMDIFFSLEGDIVSFESVCQSLCSSMFCLAGVGCVNSAWADKTQSLGYWLVVSADAPFRGERTQPKMGTSATVRNKAG